ncbi:MAG TPA: AraC family transcriptional regulator [Hansschlegelia sp.]
MTARSMSRIGAPTIVLGTVTTGLDVFIATQGGDPDRVFGYAGLSHDASDRPNDPIELNDFCNAMDESVRQTRNDNFGLWFGRQFKPEALGLLGYLATSSRTLGCALRSMTEAFPLHQENSLLRLVEAGGVCRLEYLVDPQAVASRRHDAEASLGMFCNVMRRAAGDGWTPLEVHFEHRRPEAWGEHRDAFSADVLFERPCNAIVFRPSELDRPMPGFDSTLQSIVRQSLRQIGPIQPACSSLADRVKRHVAALLPDGYPRLDDVAERLRIPAWTLQRRLADERCCFKDLIEETRREIAPRLLEQDQLSISEIAFRLGYSEISAFSRAFQRWFGASPRGWRNARLAGRTRDRATVQ